MMKRFLLLFMTLVTALATWSQSVTYLDRFGESQTLAAGSYTTVTDQVIDWSNGWYVVSSDVTFSDTCVTVYGTVHLVLMDGATLTVHKGITLETDNELDIYCQSGGTGALTATSENAYQYHAGIGGSAQQACGKLVINGGVLNIAPGECGAGIGGGGSGLHPGDGGDVTINGGTVTVTTNNPGSPLYGGGSAIGGGGEMNPTSNRYAKGSHGGTLTINGGVVHLTATSWGYAVGPGYSYAHKGNNATLYLNWSSMDDRIYMSNIMADVTMLAPFKNADTGEEVTASDNLEGITLAPINVTKYTVTFMLDGTEYDRQIITENHTVAVPDAPNVDGWLFLGWYENGATEPFDFSTPITDDLTLYARMVEKNLPTDESGAYLIGSAIDWRVFTVMLSEGIAQGDANAKLTADITEPVEYMMETTYSGTFDGQGHTLTLGLNITDNNKGLFCAINGATITDLTVAGTITTSAQYTGGLIGRASGNNTVTNCVVSASMSATFNGYGYHGGFLGKVGNYDAITFTNCVFDGSMYGLDTKYWSGFIGSQDYSNGNCNFIDCFCVPEAIEINQSSTGYILSYHPNVTRCYYTNKDLGTPLGGVILVATITAGEGVTISLGDSTIMYKNVKYYASPVDLTLNYDLPEGKLFFKYNVTSGTLTDAYTIQGSRRLKDFTGPVVITGEYIDSLIDLSSATVVASPDKVYNGREQSTTVTVTLGDNKLDYGFCYTTAFSDNVDVGEATVTITGKGPYTGTAVGHYNITPLELTADGIYVSLNTQWGHTGEPVHPLPKLTYRNNYNTTFTLVEGVDYELTYSEGCIEPGQYVVTAHGIGNYCGTRDINFEILGGIPFLNYDSATNQMVPDTCVNYQLVRSDMTELTSGWYVAKGNVSLSSDRVTVNGDVHLILLDGAKYNPQKGITVNYTDSITNSLTIYAQSEGDEMGQLVVNSCTNTYAGIGGAKNQDHGIITINGGNITVKGNASAGIGTGWDPSTGLCENSYIYIHGGIVNATGGSSSAGIGAGRNSKGGHIFITGGDVTATGYQSDYGGAGIGGAGCYGALEVNISGGTVYAKGGYYSPGIGGGASEHSSGSSGGNSGIIRISGGVVTAGSGDKYTVAIGASHNPIPVNQLIDFMELGWTNPTDRITAAGTYEGGELTIKSIFVIYGTTTLATVDNINNATIVPARAVVIDSLIEHGTVTADKYYMAYNAENQTVTLTVTPEEEYLLDQLTVTCGETEVETTAGDQPGTYTFTMPDGDVNVTATFVQPETVTLAEALTKPEGAKVLISDMLVIADVEIDGTAILTDNNGSWIGTTFDNEVREALNNAHTIKGSTLQGAVSHLDTNPVITLTKIPEAGEENVQPVFETIDLTQFIDVPGNCIAKVAGYYANGELRAYSNPNDPGQTLTIDNTFIGDALNDAQFTDMMVELTAIVRLKEPWDVEDSNGAPRRVAKTDMSSASNYIIAPVANSVNQNIITGVTQIKANDMPGVTYINAMGQTSNRPFKGVNIVVIRHTDGSVNTIKVVK